MITTCWANGQRQTATPNYEMSTMWETKPRTTPQKTSRLLMGPEQVGGLTPASSLIIMKKKKKKKEKKEKMMSKGITG